MAKYLKFTEKSYPEVVEAVNRLAEAEERTPHDAAKRLILRFVPLRIEELKNNKTITQSA